MAPFVEPVDELEKMHSEGPLQKTLLYTQELRANIYCMPVCKHLNFPG